MSKEDIPPSQLHSTAINPGIDVEEQEQEQKRQGVFKRYIERVSTLPKRIAWKTSFYQYQDFWNGSRALQGVMRVQEHFEARPYDIFVTSSPKTGTTWLIGLTFAIVNRNKYDKSATNDSTHPLLTHNSHDVVPNLEFDTYGRNPLPDVESMPSPFIFQTHIPYASLPKSVFSAGSRLVYICRNPKDVLASLLPFMNLMVGHEITSLEEAFNSFCEGVSPYGPYWDHVLGYHKASLENPNQVLFLTYEDMKRDTMGTVKKVAEFVGYPFTREEEAEGVVQEIIDLCSFDKMKNLEVNKNGMYLGMIKKEAFFREGKVGDAINHLTPEMIQRLEEITEEKFRGFDILF